MEVWKTGDPRVNFEKRFAHYEIYTWTLCNSYLHEKQTSRIQSLSQTSRGQGHKLWYHVKGLVTRNVSVKYENPISSVIKFIAKVKVFQKQVQGQNYGITWKVLSPYERSHHKEYTCNIKSINLLDCRLKQRLKFFLKEDQTSRPDQCQKVKHYGIDREVLSQGTRMKFKSPINGWAVMDKVSFLSAHPTLIHRLGPGLSSRLAKWAGPLQIRCTL